MNGRGLEALSHLAEGRLLCLKCLHLGSCAEPRTDHSGTLASNCALWYQSIRCYLLSAQSIDGDVFPGAHASGKWNCSCTDGYVPGACFAVMQVLFAEILLSDVATRSNRAFVHCFKASAACRCCQVTRCAHSGVLVALFSHSLVAARDLNAPPESLTVPHPPP